MTKCPTHLKYFPDLHRALGQMTDYLEVRCQERGISASEAKTLSVIHCHGECSVGELGKIMGLKPSTLTSMLNRLDDRELISRKTHPEDRRTFVVGLTEPGLILAKWVHDVALEMETKIGARLNAEDLAGFAATLEAIKIATGSTQEDSCQMNSSTNSSSDDNVKDNVIADSSEKTELVLEEPELESN